MSRIEQEHRRHQMAKKISRGISDDVIAFYFEFLGETWCYTANCESFYKVGVETELGTPACEGLND